MGVPKKRKIVVAKKKPYTVRHLTKIAQNISRYSMHVASKMDAITRRKFIGKFAILNNKIGIK
jgi:hypothetical protein